MAITVTSVLVALLAAFAVCVLVGLSVWLLVLFGVLTGLQSVAWVTERTSAWRMPSESDTSMPDASV
ncbi:hypothetical protein GDN83_13555 [Gordonia jinghuaiqii]|uniref:Uncharacterized protein n=1 Tax=Gordonia jinghuaiqii TaxID=2758710 RepID=A0A7D7LZ21_9ACTN|nr:hypothetical protein [Gordonia jinghuaiqii]QMT03795.1 hypothetical protein H1R19_08035 [Gordonia jinghuaiqii]